MCGSPHAELALSGGHQTTCPATDVLVTEERVNAVSQRTAARLVESHEQQPLVRAWSEAPYVREVEVLSDQESLLALCGFPDRAVGCTAETFVTRSVHIVP